jgi:predicted enzyme related to lactoylglutathione lyase
MMAEPNEKQYKIGQIISADLTIPNAEEIRDFYKAVIGWESEDLAMSDENGEYADYVMKDREGNWVGGVCHKRGGLKNFPPVWIVYVNVENIEESCQRCAALGGKILHKATNEDGSLMYAVIQDPAGSILAITKEA